MIKVVVYRLIYYYIWMFWRREKSLSSCPVHSLGHSARSLTTVQSAVSPLP